MMTALMIPALLIPGILLLFLVWSEYSGLRNLEFISDLKNDAAQLSLITGDSIRAESNRRNIQRDILIDRLSRKVDEGYRRDLLCDRELEHMKVAISHIRRMSENAVGDGMIHGRIQLHARALMEACMVAGRNYLDGSVENARIRAVTVLAICALIICHFLYILNFQYRRIYKPIRELREAALSIADGKDCRAGAYTSPDLMEIAEAFNKMAAATAATRRNLESLVEERTKAISCLFELSKLIENEALGINDILSRAPGLVAGALRRPEAAAVKLVYGKTAYQSREFSGMIYSYSSPISVNNIEAGYIIAGYLPEHHSGESLSLSGEERELVDTFADQLARALEQCQAVLQLQRSEHKYRTLLDTIPQRVFYKDKHGCYRTVNPAFVRDMALTPEEIIGKTDFKLFPHELARQHSQEDRQVAENRTIMEFEGFHVLTGGVKIHTRTVKAPVFDDMGEADGILGIYEDISSRKLAEERLLKTMRQLEESNGELRQFAYVASHDLQEPLRMVISYMQLIHKRYGDKLDGDAVMFMDFAVKGATRMKNLIDALLSFSRVGGRKLQYSDIDMEMLLCEVMNILQLKIEEGKAEITHDPLPNVRGDQIQIGQLLQNLLGNAIKFCRGHAPKIHVSCRKDEDNLIFCVKDNGIGIRKEFQEKVFEIFQRLHGQDQFEGTGIGLAVCRKIVERHHGRIWAESDGINGTEMYFSLPVHTEEEGE